MLLQSYKHLYTTKHFKTPNLLNYFLVSMKSLKHEEILPVKMVVLHTAM